MLRRDDFFMLWRFLVAQALEGTLCAYRGLWGPRRQAIGQDVQTILVVTLDRLGDILVTFPGVEAIRELYPGARLVYLTTWEGSELVRGRARLDEIVCLDFPWAGEGNVCHRAVLQHTLQTLQRLRRRRFDLSIGFHPDLFSIAVQAFVGARYRIAPAFKGGSGLLTGVAPSSATQHIRARVAATLSLLGWHGKLGMPCMPLAAAETSWAEVFLREHGGQEGDLVVGLAPGARDPAKRWPAGRWAELARALLLQGSVRLLVVGGQREEGLADQIRALTGGAVINAVGRTDLRYTAALISRMHLLVTVDSLARHLAAAVGTPAVVLQYAGDRPGTWGQYRESEYIVRRHVPCSPCGTIICPRPTHDCMLLITPGEILEEIRRRSLLVSAPVYRDPGMSMP